MRLLLTLALLALPSVAGATACGFSGIAVGNAAILAIKNSDGTIQCWGDDGNAICSGAPGGSFTSLAADQVNGCGVKTDGSLVCWGDDSHDVVGDVPAGTNFVDVKLGSVEACALKTDNSVVCWGNTSAISALSTWTAPSGSYTQISGHQDAYCGRKTSGAIGCWGYLNEPKCASGGHAGATCSSNADCSLCTPHTTEDDVHCTTNANCVGADTCQTPGTACAVVTPLLTVPAGTDFAQVSAQFETACAVKNDGSIVCWGDDNGTGVIGSEPAGTFTRVQVMADDGAAACAIKASDGSLTCWGYDGDGIVTTKPGSGAFTGMDGWIWETCGLDSAGNAICWGGDYEGETSGTPSPDCTPGTTTTTLPPTPGASSPVVCFVAG